MNEIARIFPEDASALDIACRDGVRLGGHFWPARDGGSAGNVVINPATGVPARYYHRYAGFLRNHGFSVLTYDYRGIGASRPARMKGCGYRWRDWGELDFDAAIGCLHERRTAGPIVVVGHSVGGFLPGLAANASLIDRMLTIGAQYAWWVDYAPHSRFNLFLKWHVAMPAITALCGYFPGRRLGWLEDLPSGVANEWSFRGRRFERSHPRSERQAVVSRMAGVTAPILAIAVSDDELGTVPAIRRTLAYYADAPRVLVRIEPSYYGCEKIGHFNLFRDSHSAGFWTDTLIWLRDGRNPWPGLVLPERIELERAGRPQA